MDGEDLIKLAKHFGISIHPKTIRAIRDYSMGFKRNDDEHGSISYYFRSKKKISVDIGFVQEIAKQQYFERPKPEEKPEEPTKAKELNKITYSVEPIEEGFNKIELQKGSPKEWEDAFNKVGVDKKLLNWADFDTLEGEVSREQVSKLIQNLKSEMGVLDKIPLPIMRDSGLVEEVKNMVGLS